MDNKKYKIDFIEPPEVFNNEEMMEIVGGGLCIGFTNCGCNIKDKKGTYSNCKETKNIKNIKNNSNNKHKYFIKKYKHTFCIIVTIK